MTPRKLEAALAAAFPPRAAPAPGHREALGRELTARFRERQPPEDAVKLRTWIRPAAVAAGLLAAAAAGSQVPADFRAEIGKRIEVRAPAPPPREELRAVVEALTAGAPRVEARVEVRRRDGEPALVRIDLWGDTARLQDVDALVRRAAPSLAGADVTVSPVEGTVHGDVADALEQWLGQGDLPPDRLAEAIRREIAAREGGEVEVDVQEEGGRRKVEVRVRKEEVRE